MDITIHPVQNPLCTPSPSPPGSPSEEIDVEFTAASYPPSGRYDAGHFFSRAKLPSDADPLLLKTRLQSEQTLAELRKRKNGTKGRTLGSFYKNQNERIKSMLKSMDDHIEEAAEDEDNNRRAVKIAIYGSLVCNWDSVFDPAANFVLNYCHRKAQRVDLQAYPSGGARFETVGDLTYSGVMAAVSVVLVAFSIQELIKGDSDLEIYVPAVVAVGIAFVTKLGLFLYCYSIRGKNSQVRVLWEDHRNDLFINGFGLFTSAAGAKIQWWIDPAGAMIISFILIFVWGNTIYHHFTYLAGRAAPQEFQQLVLYKSLTFAEGIEKIDSCVVYHSGPVYIVEIDIVMASDTPLWKAHDISQALQDKIEELPKVGRAFVHVDHEVSHKPEHRKYK
ncbi:hypothetical protein MNV49_004917 [Pseudohyphozyma bogoriensis]|nr:hypothetical protein MNV49_004917 [Pseudohyphozyma bogoriensis]